jgi:hypothetical protein
MYNYIKKNIKDTEKNIEDNYNFNQVWKLKCSNYENEQSYVLPPVNRIIVIGDLHGDLDITLRSLKIANLIDNNNNWIGGDTVVVQNGDQVDRCRYNGIPCSNKLATSNDEENDITILELFTKLHKQAQLYGGAVYSLLGNHELMNVEGDLRYVSHLGLKQFDNSIINGNLIKDGKIAREMLFSPGNKYAEFLACTRQVVLIIGNNIFIHGGILPKIIKKYSVKSINQIMTLYLLGRIKQQDKLYKDIFKSQDLSPLWSRLQGLMVINNNDNSCHEMLTPLKYIYNVNNIYVGHTPNLNNGISSACNKHIWLTDYGASKSFDSYRTNPTKKLQVLEILNDGHKFNILYEKLPHKTHHHKTHLLYNKQTTNINIS